MITNERSEEKKKKRRRSMEYAPGGVTAWQLDGQRQLTGKKERFPAGKSVMKTRRSLDGRRHEEFESEQRDKTKVKCGERPGGGRLGCKRKGRERFPSILCCDWG